MTDLCSVAVTGTSLLDIGLKTADSIPQKEDNADLQTGDTPTRRYALHARSCLMMLRVTPCSTHSSLSQTDQKMATRMTSGCL